MHGAAHAWKLRCESICSVKIELSCWQKEVSAADKPAVIDRSGVCALLMHRFKSPDLMRKERVWQDRQVCNLFLSTEMNAPLLVL